MAKTPTNQTNVRPVQRLSPAVVTPQASISTQVAGAAFLLLAAAMSCLLVVEHVAGLTLPGCGPGSACEQLAKSAWGKIAIGGFQWPVSFAGFAYFLAALTGWIAARGALPSALRYVARLGALASLVFCIVIVRKWMFCPYCLAAHAGNFAFWITMEATRARTRRAAWPLGLAALVFVVASVVMGAVDAAQRARLAAKGEKDRAASAAEIIKRSREPAPTTRPAGAQPAPTQPTTPPASQSSTATTANSPQTFTGRWRLGPEEAAIRIFVFTDFQCPDCRQIEGQIQQVLKTYPSISVSMKHYPFCVDCNKYAPRSLHANACWAARAAEAAGILYGNDGFWKLHDWLFEHRGSFTTTQELENGIQSLGYDSKGFVQMMTSEEPLRRIRQDCDDAQRLGLFFTPMIFINGVELKGWYQPNALVRTVAEVAAANPPPRTAAYDRPPLAFEKYVQDWADETVRTLPPDKTAWVLGPPDAKAKIVLWGDFQEDGTAQVDQVIRTFIAQGGSANYVFRHMPFNGDCNPNIPYRRHPLACWASRAAEAAGRLGSNDGYWKMHAWLIDNHDAALKAAAQEAGVDAVALRGALYTMSEDERKKGAAKLGVDAQRALDTMQRTADESLRAAAQQMGLDADALFEAMKRDDVQASIAEDIQAGKTLPVLRWGAPAGVYSIPTIFINSKCVPRYQLDGDIAVLEQILKRAAGE